MNDLYAPPIAPLCFSMRLYGFHMTFPNQFRVVFTPFLCSRRPPGPTQFLHRLIFADRPCPTFRSSCFLMLNLCCLCLPYGFPMTFPIEFRVVFDLFLSSFSRSPRPKSPYPYLVAPVTTTIFRVIVVLKFICGQHPNCLFAKRRLIVKIFIYLRTACQHSWVAVLKPARPLEGLYKRLRFTRETT